MKLFISMIVGGALMLGTVMAQSTSKPAAATTPAAKVATETTKKTKVKRHRKHKKAAKPAATTATTTPAPKK